MTSLVQITLVIARFEQESFQSESIPIDAAATLKRLLKEFNDSFENKTSTWDERCQIAPFILSSLLRILNRAVSAEDCKIYNIRLAIVCTECLHKIFTYANIELDRDFKAAVFATLTITDDKIFNVICNIILLVIALMESLKVEDSFHSASSDFEVLSIQSFSFYKMILKCWLYYRNLVVKQNSSVNHPVPQVVSGPCLAQLIQSSLFFSKHLNKTLAEEALGALLLSIKYAVNVEDWRSYFPGTFSGLHTICSMGQNRGSSVLSIALECLIALVISITDDTLYHSLPFLISSEGSEFVSDAFNEMKKLANEKWNKFANSENATDNFDLPDILNSLQLQQWRVDILQKIEKYFPQAFKSVYYFLSPKQRVLSLNSLGMLLTGSRSFLGQTVFNQFLLLFTPAFDDNTLIVREAARSGWFSLKKIETNRDRWQTTCSFLTKTFVYIVENELKVSHSSLEKDSKIQEYVSTLIGIGETIGDELGIVVKAGGTELIKKVIALLLPDLEGGSKSQILDVRQYHTIQSKSFVGSYYRLPWLSARNENCKSSIRKLCFLLGKYDALSDITSLLSNFQSSLENQMIKSINNSTGVSSKLVDRVLAGWIFVCNGVIGLGNITKLETNPKTMPCGLCGTNTIPRRCTRCLDISYCCKDHQQQHWLHHKEHCTNIAKGKANEMIDDTKDGTDAERKYYGNDIFDPEILITSATFTCSVPKNSVSYKTVTNIIKAAMQYVKFYIKWTNCHLQTLSVGKNMHNSIDLSIVLSQAAASDLFLSTTNFIMRVSLITATCVECIANCIALLGANFRENLFELIYNFLELLCDPYHYPILKQAVNTSLLRIAHYLLYENFSELLLDVLDSVVDLACNSIKKSHQEPSLQQESSGDLTIKSGVWRTHLVIDFVLNELGDNFFVEIPYTENKGKITTTFALFSDMVADTLTNIDKMAALNFIPNDQITAIIRVMLVLVRRTLPKIDIDSLQLSNSWTSQSYVIKRLYKSSFLINNTIDKDCQFDEHVADIIISDISSSLLQFKNALSILKKEHMEPLESDHSVTSENVDVDVSDNTSDESNPTPGMKLILDILERCAYFLAQPKLGNRVLLIETIASSFLRLSFNKRVLYPAVHRMWPAIMNRLKEQGQIFISNIDIPENNEYKKSKGKENRSSDLISFGQSAQTKYSKIIFDHSAESKNIEQHNNNNIIWPNPIHSHMILLSPMLELLMITATVCDDFLAIKFQEDVWPQLHIILQHNALIDLSNLINYDYSTKHTEMSKFSLLVKLKLAILSFINQIAILPKCSVYVKANAKALIWFLVPYLCTFQGKDIIELAMVGIRAVFNLEPVFGFILMNSILDNQLTSWNGITTDPCISDILDKKICTVEVILRYYRKDLELLERIKEIINTNDLMKTAAADRKWYKHMKNWAAI